MFEYTIPIIVFLVVAGIVYKMNEPENNAQSKALIYGIVVGVIVFFSMKFSGRFGTHEPVMQGNYFE
jgi:hypothetical protein